ncbi:MULTISPECIES: monovalent cation/H+ antiporter subunit D [Marinobacter]|jgi:multicomponent K+:H+ antiporter subunit D|uniref:Multisubunit potassium/proton antiporter, PhaD subunit n=1 Tax=Marinobacter salarius TaxID=1420917 RepID=A0A1W6K7M8_9GAMM|nr:MULTISPECIES: monovalent cation/H+ antiporter subunit D [Marinobacter]ARM83352.1 Na(+)/H(+) antiporter subunit D [Marinobacter salarius]KXJ48587.1 MAG: cation:proton antiporter [Marinobacter sp. Hex_13]MBJ7299139.1 monovalent cation/H+ antiporter subunit D [Marinobacter salarius]MBS8230008.1 monovalent cation/H+ antiporter subunit D [Marinobacter salarius]MCC4282996.1 monovalent cation/H+ antiporter subunit D [Marinobacter salarius]|tara:strand:- start:1272 stop:2789 length:1518 start_codon:yes stop_codon:yes gene_type:complete
MNHWLTAPILIPLIGGILQAFMGYAPIALRRTLAIATTVLMLVAAIVLLVLADDGSYRLYAFGNWQPPFGIVLVLDRLAALMLVMTAVLALFCHIYAIGGTDESSRQFHGLFLFQLLGLNIAFLTGDLFNLFVAFEVLLIASYGLLMHGEGTSRTVPGLHYVVLNLAGSAVFLIAVGMIYSVTGTLNMADLAVKIPQVAEENLPLVKAGGMMLLVVFGLKAAILPLCFWLPGAYSNATAPVAALFAVMTKVGIYAIIRVFTLIFGNQAGELSGLGMDWLFPLALITLTMGVIGALGAASLRKLIAWQVIISVGTLLAAISFGTVAGTSAALFYLLNTTWVAGGLFLVADLVDGQRGSAQDKIVTAPRIANRTFLSVLFLMGAVAAVGLPPLSGFFAKLLILKSAVTESDVAWLWSVLLIGSFFTLIAYSRAGSIVFWRNVEGHIEEPQKLTPSLSVSASALISLSIVMVILAGPISRYAEDTAAQLHDTSAYTEILSKPMVGEEK